MWWLPLLALPLTQGTPDDGDPAVVAIVRASDGALRCTGTVIAERVVLTAAHCGVQLEPSAYRVFFGSRVGDAGTTIDILEAIAHPGFDDTETHDLALVLLAEASPSSPVAISTQPPPGQLRIVGFGDTAGGANDGARKLEGTTAVTSSLPFSIVLGADPSLPCSGDSGGPAFAGAEVTAVISRGDPDCATYGKATRVDAHAAELIAPYVAATAPGSVDIGERCKYDAHCATGSCVTAADEPLLRYCSQACTRASDCPADMTCEDSACRYPTPSPGAIGAACDANDECLRGQCIDDGYCSIRCVSGRGDCPDDFECSHLGGVDFFCTPVPDDGGCCDTSGNGSAGAALLGFGLALWISTGRRRSNRRT